VVPLAARGVAAVGVGSRCPKNRPQDSPDRREAGFFERAPASVPENDETLVRIASVDYARATSFFRMIGWAARGRAETKLTKALSLSPQHALAHMLLGAVQVHISA
jgi:hypothetical protein